MSAIAEETTAPRGGRVGTGRPFYLAMALAIAATSFWGFGRSAAMHGFNYSTLPPLVHVHALVFVAWILFFVLQSGLIVSGSVTLHRRLGLFGAAVAALMVALGVATTIGALQREGGVPPFFPRNIFLVLDCVGALTFGGLTAAAIVLRRKAEWHKRLMLCGTIVVMSPALGRILPMPQLGKLAPLAVFGCVLVYVLAGVVHDLVTRKRIHPAYYWGLAVIAITQFLIPPLAFTPVVVDWTARLGGH